MQHKFREATRKQNILNIPQPSWTLLNSLLILLKLKVSHFLILRRLARRLRLITIEGILFFFCMYIALQNCMYIDITLYQNASSSCVFSYSRRWTFQWIAFHRVCSFVNRCPSEQWSLWGHCGTFLCVSSSIGSPWKLYCRGRKCFLGSKVSFLHAFGIGDISSCSLW